MTGKTVKPWTGQKYFVGETQLFDLPLLVEKGTREVLGRTLPWLFPCSLQSRLLHVLINNDLQHNCIAPIVGPFNSGNVSELVLRAACVCRNTSFCCGLGGQGAEQLVVGSTLRGFFIVLLAEKLLIKAAQACES